MKFLNTLFSFNKKVKVSRSGLEQKQELLIKQGRDQFKKLLEKGLSVPVALL